MKMKPKTKKIIVLSVMVALLVATGVLNFVLSDKLNKTSTDVARTTGHRDANVFCGGKKRPRRYERVGIFVS